MCVFFFLSFFLSFFSLVCPSSVYRSLSCRVTASQCPLAAATMRHFAQHHPRYRLYAGHILLSPCDVNWPRLQPNVKHTHAHTHTHKREEGNKFQSHIIFIRAPLAWRRVENENKRGVDWQLTTASTMAVCNWWWDEGRMEWGSWSCVVCV